MTGNVFFAVRGALELAVGISLYAHYKREFEDYFMCCISIQCLEV